MPSIIVDLDSTLCNCDHRVAHINSGTKNWDAFYEAMKDDGVYEWCKSLLHAMESTTAIVFLTGRPQKYMDVTRDWFDKHFGAGWLLRGRKELYMRPDGDFRKDTVVKREIYEERIKPWHKDILFAIDDRRDVVKMWREIGIVCLHCADGDY